jgi:hypothetical protein
MSDRCLVAWNAVISTDRDVLKGHPVPICYATTITTNRIVGDCREIHDERAEICNATTIRAVSIPYCYVNHSEIPIIRNGCYIACTHKGNTANGSIHTTPNDHTTLNASTVSINANVASQIEYSMREHYSTYIWSDGHNVSDSGH